MSTPRSLLAALGLIGLCCVTGAVTGWPEQMGTIAGPATNGNPEVLRTSREGRDLLFYHSFPAYPGGPHTGLVVVAQSPLSRESMNVEIHGYVRHQGPMSVAHGTTVLQAIAEAGGFTEPAFGGTLIKRHKGTNSTNYFFLDTYLRAEPIPGRLNHYAVWSDGSKRGTNQQDVLLEPGDVLVVKPRRPSD